MAEDSVRSAEELQAIEEGESRWKLALDAAGHGVWDWNIVTGAAVLSKRLKEMYGFTEEEVENHANSWFSRLHPDDTPRMQQQLSLYLDGTIPAYEVEVRVHCKDGSWKWILTRGMVVAREADGRPRRMIGTNTDISEIKRKEEDLKIAGLVYQAIGEAILVADRDQTIIAVNPSFTAMTGYGEADLIGRPVFELAVHDNDHFVCNMLQMLAKTGRWQGEMRMRDRSGAVQTRWLMLNTIYDADGTVLRRVCLFSQVTDQKRAEATIWRQANFDPLTALPNRRLFHDRLASELARAAHTQSGVALLFIDLDQFKEVNDTLGHQAGDRLLERAARRIERCVPQGAAVARLGGDEFTVILPAVTGREPAEHTAQRILAAIGEAFDLDDEMLYLTASIGITHFPEEGADVDTLLKNADQAMYAAKRAGRNGFRHFTASLQENAQSRQALLRDLRTALEQDQLRVHFQPVVEPRSGLVVKAEALLRWQHPVRGMVSPMTFIPLAEESGLIDGIGDWVFRQAAQWAKRWNTRYPGGFQVSVNVSPVQFQANARRCAHWNAWLREERIPQHSVVIEITEGLLLHADPGVTERLLSLRENGIEVAIDDFGTGYSSLAYLKKFNIDFLKIDQSFVRNLATDASDMALSEAIVVMAHKLGLRVIAEGVETEQQQRCLLEAGCDYVQGYLYSRPVPPAEFEALADRLNGIGM
jgi:diguanylate cyclase (GGDEF)-like protein/PAS domain S-box-containing protein